MRTLTRIKADLDQGFLPGRSRRAPKLYGDLLTVLGVTDESFEAQREAVTVWLESHRPNRLLRDDLRAHGFLS